MFSSISTRVAAIALFFAAVAVLFFWQRGNQSWSGSSLLVSGSAQPPGFTAPGHSERRRHQAPEVAHLERKVAALESEVSALRSETTEASREASSPSGGDAASLAQLTEEEERAYRAREEDRVFTQFGQAFAAQPLDQPWSTAMTQRLRDHLQARPLARSSVEDIECRASACRIEIGLQDGADLAAIRDGFRHEMADVMGAGASKRDAAGKLVLYLAKDPQSLGM